MFDKVTLLRIVNIIKIEKNCNVCCLYPSKVILKEKVFTLTTDFIEICHGCPVYAQCTTVNVQEH